VAEFKVEKAADARSVPKRIAFVQERTAARVRREEEELVMTVPHLVVREAIAFMVMVIVLAVLSLLFNAPLEWIANPEHTPNPAKAPWYFLGLQELLHYFPPVVAGVILPVLVILALVAIPYFPVNLKLKGLWRENRRSTLLYLLMVSAALSMTFQLYRVFAMLVPTIAVTGCMLLPYFIRKETGLIGWLGSRPLTWWIMTWFVVIALVLTTIGTLFRGPEWSWTWPWREIY